MACEKAHTLEQFDFIETPPALQASQKVKYDIKATQYASIKNAPLPADGAGRPSFSNITLITSLIGIPLLLAKLIGGGIVAYLLLVCVTTIPILMAYWRVASTYSPRINQKVKIPGKPVEYYLDFKSSELKSKYSGNNKIPMETFYELYFDGQVDFKGDALEILEFRHDWATFQFTMGLYRFFLFNMIPELLVHSRSQDEEQVRDHYDRGDDFYAWFLGKSMVYTSGIMSDVNKEESLEELQNNKLAIVCEKIDLQNGQRVLDIGCGWGALTWYASKQYGASVTGVTLGKNQAAWGNYKLQSDNLTKSKILCMDYRDIPMGEGQYDKIICLEMAEHVGVRHFSSFLKQVYSMLKDDGIFFLQIAGLRRPWQYEDLIWGLFMNKYIFPGADASTPLGWFVGQLESAGFEISAIDTIGVHYSATLWRWYRNWLGNKEKVIGKYGVRWFRIWELFLSWSTIISRQGSATCYQIILVKNINSTDRAGFVRNQFGLLGALRNG